MGRSISYTHKWKCGTSAEVRNRIITKGNTEKILIIIITVSILVKIFVSSYYNKT